MEDATKATAKSLYASRSDPGFEQLDSGAQGAPQTGAEESVQPEQKISTGEKALDRWFRENRGRKRVPKRLEIPNEAQVTSAGPLTITGNITLIDEDGTVTHANHLSLCRCGASKKRPYCDDQHLEIEFFDIGNIHKASDCMPLIRPQTVTITCEKDGPLRYRGYLKVFNSKGQEYLSMQGALCRCGKSTAKPFCDCR